MSEYVQSAGAVVLFVAILIGPCWFVLCSPGSPGRREEQRRAERERKTG